MHKNFETVYEEIPTSYFLERVILFRMLFFFIIGRMRFEFAVV